MKLQANLWQATCLEKPNCCSLDEDISVDLAIIGGGITGVSAALKASELGASTCLVEAEEIGHGGSGRNVGLVNAGLWTPPDEIVDKLGREAGEHLVATLAAAPEMVFGLIARYQIECEAMRHGTLHCAHAPSAMHELQSRESQQLKRGAPVKLLDAREALRVTGTKAVHGALYDPRAGTIQPLAYCRGLARAAIEQGAQVYNHTRVDSVVRGSQGWQLSCGSRRIRCSYLLLASNAYHRDVAGLTQPAAVPVYFSQFATAPLTDAQRSGVLPELHGCWDTALVMSSFRLDHAGRLIVGGIGNTGTPLAGMHAQWAQRKLSQLYPELDRVKIEQGWSGRIAMTGDHLPKIVQSAPEMYSIYGYSGRGIGPGTVFGVAAAEALLEGNPGSLPVAPIAGHYENWKRPRAFFYETGALLTHFIGSRG